MLQFTSDMILLENQIPFFLLQDLFVSVYPEDDFRPLVVMAICQRFSNVLLPLGDILHFDCLVKLFNHGLLKEVHHFLHLFQILLVVRNDVHNDKLAATATATSTFFKTLKSLFSKRSADSVLEAEKVCLVVDRINMLSEEPMSIKISQVVLKSMKEFADSARKKSHMGFKEKSPSVTELTNAGVKFEVNKDSMNFLRTTFRNGSLRLPQLTVDSQTNYIFRNLIAFEQHYRKVKNHVSMHCVFIDYLIDNEADVLILTQNGIIINGLGSNQDISLLFNELCKRVHVDNIEGYDLYNLCRELRNYANQRVNRYRAKFIRDYFGNPWAIISLAAAFVLLCCTIIQTVFGIIN